jgi:hypothetical protein
MSDKNKQIDEWKRAKIERILAGSVYLPKSGVYQIAFRALARLSKAAISAIELVTTVKVKQQ